MLTHRNWIGHVAVVVCGAISLIIGGCSGKTSSAERTEFAKLYAELLIVENTYRNDTARQNQMLDNLLQETDFANRQEMTEWLEQLAAGNPKELQEMLDSTQKYLEQARDGINGAQQDTSTGK